MHDNKYLIKTPSISFRSLYVLSTFWNISISFKETSKLHYYGSHFTFMLQYRKLEPNGTLIEML